MSWGGGGGGSSGGGGAPFAPLLAVDPITDGATHVLWRGTLTAADFGTSTVTLATHAAVQDVALSLDFDFYNVTDASSAGTTSHAAVAPDTQTGAVTLAAGAKVYELRVILTGFVAPPHAADIYSASLKVS
jgi:hypothetical protein